MKNAAMAGGLVIPPNLIDFRTVFSNLGQRFLDSPVVLSVIVGIILLYVLILLWARRQDKKDQDMVSLQHLLTQLLTQWPGMHETSNFLFICSGGSLKQQKTVQWTGSRTCCMLTPG